MRNEIGSKYNHQSLPKTNGKHFELVIPREDMNNKQSSDNQIEKAYTKRANRFFFEVVAIQIVAFIIVAMLISSGDGGGAILIPLLTIAVSFALVHLMFRHVDTLILTRLTQLEDGTLG